MFTSLSEHHAGLSSCPQNPASLASRHSGPPVLGPGALIEARPNSQMDVSGQEAMSEPSAGAGVRVEIGLGTIENVQVDAIVSPMVGHDPASTRIGKILNNVTGGQLEVKFYQEAGEATLPSETVVVEGLPGLKCKAVIFLNLLCWDDNQNGSAVQALRQGIKRIFAICNIRGYSSVTLPVLGTGVLLRFPPKITSLILLEEVGIYGQNQISRSGFLVRVIIHPKDKESSQAFWSAQGILLQRGFINNIIPDQGSFYQCLSLTKDEITAMMGGVKLQILCGDIVNERTDVIVNTTNFENLWFGVSKAILTAAGPAVHAELTQVGIPEDLICTTAAGKLGCKEIIHARFKRQTRRIRNTCQKILKLCEGKGFSSVAFPAINTGQAGMDFVESCKAMLDGMASAIRDINPNSLSLIRIVILQQPVYQAFRSELESRCLQDVQSCFSLKGDRKGPMKKILEMYLGISMTQSTEHQTGILPDSEPGCVASTIALELPAHWEPMKGEDFKKVELQPDSPEYQEVAVGFCKANNYNIHKIERIQNLYLWHAFTICRYRIISKNGEEELGEKFLYHGTSVASCNSIERDRFDRSYAGKHATLYGKGVYFAVDANYSANTYSLPDTSGLKRLYVARVLTGRYTVGNPSMKTLPRRGTEATDCFDSLVNNQENPSIFVIFHDDQAYPEYLITFS